MAGTLTFRYDDKEDERLEELKYKFNVKNKNDVLRILLSDRVTITL